MLIIVSNLQANKYDYLFTLKINTVIIYVYIYIYIVCLCVCVYIKTRIKSVTMTLVYDVGTLIYFCVKQPWPWSSNKHEWKNKIISTLKILQNKNESRKNNNKLRRWKKRKKRRRVFIFIPRHVFLSFPSGLNIERKGTGRFFYAHAAWRAIESASSRRRLVRGKKTSFNLINLLELTQRAWTCLKKQTILNRIVIVSVVIYCIRLYIYFVFVVRIDILISNEIVKMGSVEEIYESEIHRTVTRRTSFKIHEVN